MAARSWMGQRRPPPSPKKGGALAADKCDAFCVALALKLDALEQAVHSKRLTLEWVSLAVDFMRSTYSDVVALFEDLRAVSHDVKGAEEFWVEEYMVESMKLLDLCNVLKPAVSRFEHFMMCVQLVVQASQRCSAGGQEYSSDKTLTSALESCELELKQLVHPPLAAADSVTALHMGPPQMAIKSPSGSLRVSKSPPAGGAPPRYASITIGEKITFGSAPAPKPNNNGGGGYKARGDGLALVMRATRETTDFIASVLVWALMRNAPSHPNATAWQQNLDVFRGDESTWSPAFRRLQERLRREMFELVREERAAAGAYCFAFEELKLVEECTADLRVEIEVLAARKDLGEMEGGDEPAPLRLFEPMVQQLKDLLAKIQGGLERASSEVNHLFNELVRARKKLLDAAQRPGTIHRAHTF